MEIIRMTVRGRDADETNAQSQRTDKKAKVRNAAYIRVSNESDTSDESYEMQEAHFKKLIDGSHDMELIEIYGDRGISGRHTFKREGFNKMMMDARDHAFERILCKSVSRFARNMRDCMENIHILQSCGISVCFEKEGLDTADPKSDLLLSIIAILSQEESESIKNNIEMSRRKRMPEGTPWENPCYGYRYDKNTLSWRIEEHEALMVRELFKLALCGMKYAEIKSYMEALDPNGKWSQSNIRERLIKPDIFDLRQRHSRPDREKPLESSVSAGSRGFFFLRWLPGCDGTDCFAAAGFVLP